MVLCEHLSYYHVQNNFVTMWCRTGFCFIVRNETFHILIHLDIYIDLSCCMIHTAISSKEANTETISHTWLFQRQHTLIYNIWTLSLYNLCFPSAQSNFFSAYNQVIVWCWQNCIGLTCAVWLASFEKLPSAIIKLFWYPCEVSFTES